MALLAKDINVSNLDEPEPTWVPEVRNMARRELAHGREKGDEEA